MKFLSYLKSLMLIMLALTATGMWAANVDSHAAQAKAIQFMNSQPGTRFMASTSTLKLTHAEPSTVNTKLSVFYVFNYDGGGFVIVSGDDRAEEILGYGDGTLDMNNIPSNMRWWLNQYKAQIDFLFQNPKLEVKRMSEQSHMLTASTVSPMLTCIWDQEAPFYNQCPTRSGSRCLTGCVATAMAQVMYYWKYPNRAPALAGYTTLTRRIQMPALPGTDLDWNNMIDDYTGSYTTAQGNAVATLMLYCGQSCNMDYDTYSAGGSGAYTTDQLTGMKAFGYNSGATYVQRNNYTDSQWTAMMLEDLQAGRPILYGGDDGTYGHAFVVDGYNANTNKYHINWGWSGIDNNYFAISSFMIDSDYDFRQNQDMLYQIYPEGSAIETYAPVMADASNVGTTSFKATWTDQTSSENVTDYTLYVQAYDPNVQSLLTETFSGVTATSDGSTNISNSLDQYCDNAGWTGTYVFQAGGGGLKLGNSNNGGSVTTPALDLSSTGGTITVKLNAKLYNTDGTVLTIACGNASETVTLTNAAADYTVTLSGVTASAGQKVTISSTGSRKRWYLYNVEISAGSGNKLTASETGDANNRVITGITSKNYTVNNLTAGGSYKFYVKANYTDGTSKESNVKTVTLEGSAVPTPELVVDSETLTMTANVGETTTATFDVLGADLTGNVTVTLSDANGVFTINPTTITKTAAENGATVTVTYAPTLAGQHTATVTITSEGAEAVTVTLNGTAAMPTTAPVMATATNVGTTSFKATWTDATSSQYVTNYTLYVNKVGGSSDALLTEAFGGVTATNDGTTRIEGSLDDYCDNAGWTGNYVYQAGGGGLKFGNSTNGGYLTSPALDLSNCGGVITVAFSAKNYGTDATTLTISCGDVSETVALTGTAADYTVTLNGVTAAAGQQVTLSSTGSRQRWYLYSVNIYNGTVAKASETGDANNRVITGITAKNYTVEGLTPGETYNFYVEANYTDGTKAASNHEQVTLQGAAPTPELVVDPETLTMTANVGETATATFNVLGADLTGNVTVTLNDETGFYSINPATISIADAEEGAAVTVTYAPTAAGEHAATITIASNGAEAVTVTLNGTAAMPTTAPVMAAATNVGSTSFTATWTDATATQYVTNYTLYVNRVGGSGAALLTETFDLIDVTRDGTIDRGETLDDYCDNAGWTGYAAYEAVGGGIKLGSGTKLGYLTTPALDLTDCGGTITVAFNAKSYGSDNTSITISCGDVTETVELTAEAADYNVVLTGVPAEAGQNVTISSVAAGKRFYIYNVNVYGGAGSGADSRVITGITAKTYTVEGLTPGETYTFYVEANYTDGTKAASNVEQVTLEGAVPEPVVIVDNETLEVTANVLETATVTFDVLASDLTDEVTVTLNDETGLFTVTPATISIADAEEGATVTVTYAPTAAGEHTATVTLTSEGAEDVTVTINATAVMETLAPEMQPADMNYVTTTSFRADWVDVTPEQYVTSYTLYVNKKQEIPAGAVVLTETFYSEEVPTSDSNIDEGANGTLDDCCDNPGWTGYGVYLAGGGGMKLGAGTKTGYLTTPALDLTNCGGTVTVKFNALSYGTDGSSVIVSCGEVADTVELTTEGADYTVVLTGVPAEADQHVTLSCIANKKRFYLYSVTIISGEEVARAVSETGDADSRVITGITDQFYVVENLTPGATYEYYVKALYIDGTDANSNVETVTLLEEQGHGFQVGDVNHDGNLTVADVTMLISYVLANGSGAACPICADVNGDSNISIGDVTALINKVLSGN